MTESSSDKSDTDQPGDRAIDWLVRLNADSATEADRAAFAAWRTADPAHEAAARASEALWRDLGHTRQADEFRRTAVNEAACAARRTRITRRAVLAGAAASVAVIALGSNTLAPVSGFFADHVTAIGERRTVTLPDGSHASLNTASALSVGYSESERRIVLHGGEVWFGVARNTARPFIVEAANGEAKAVGTAYAVRHRDGGDVDVIVTEGLVDVSTKADGRVLRLKAGEAAAYGVRHRLARRRDTDAETVTAWRRGKLIFNRRPLGEVVAELERYRRGRIVVLGDGLKTLRVTGVFDLADPESLLRTVEHSLPVRIVRLPLLTVIH
ncbi:MAG: FecR family protein [Rhodospirillales bacterium]